MSLWESIKSILYDFVHNTGLSIARAIAFLVLGIVVVRIVQVIARSSIMKSKLDKSASTFVLSLVTIILYIVVAAIVIRTLGFSTAGIIAAFSAVALAIALALKDSLGSLANGVIIIFTKPFKKGDYVQINGVDGLVQDIRLFNTKILTYSNDEIIVPNSEILSSKLINYSTMPLRRVVTAVPVPRECNVDEVKTMLLECAATYKYAVSTPAPSVVLEKYTPSALNFSVRVWTENEHYWDTMFDMNERILSTLREHGIELPYEKLEVSLAERASSERGEGEV